jgi:DNA polymerase elongation subunit (family B)
MSKYSELSDADKRKRIEELKQKISTVKSEHDYAKAMQLALKLVLNGTYGAFCHKAFTVSNSDIANSITSMSRDVINYMLDTIEDYFYNKWHDDKDLFNLLGVVYITKLEDGYYINRKDGELIDVWARKDDIKSSGVQKIFETYNLEQSDIAEKDVDFIENNGKKYEVLYKISIFDVQKINPLPSDYSIEPDDTSKSFDKARGLRETPIIIYGDTDSISADSVINTDNGKIFIEDLYNENIRNGFAGETLNGHESVRCNDKVLNYSEEKGLYYASVKRVIRHKVSKPKWKLKTKSGKEIIMTDDHSMIVFRNGIQLEVKPSEILKSDKILCVKE